MKLEEIAQLIQLLKANGVTRFKSDDIEIRFKAGSSVQIETKSPPIFSAVNQINHQTNNMGQNLSAASAPPVDLDIVHHVNEVANLLKLGDEDLVDKLFPDYTQPSKEA